MKRSVTFMMNLAMTKRRRDGEVLKMNLLPVVVQVPKLSTLQARYVNPDMENNALLMHY